MYKGSTPTFSIECENSLEDVSSLEVLCVQSYDRFSHGKVSFVLEPENLDKEKGTFNISFTEKQTLSFKAGYPVKFQLKAQDSAGHVAYSNIISVRVYDTLETSAAAKNASSQIYSSSYSGCDCECVLRAYFSGEFVAMGEYESYTGAYMVTPAKHAQTLPTKGKALSDDIEISAITYKEIENEAGGITLEFQKGLKKWLINM